MKKTFLKKLVKKSRTNLICSLVQFILFIIAISLFIYLLFSLVFPATNNLVNITDGVKGLERIWKSNNIDETIQQFFDPSAISNPETLVRGLRSIIDKYNNLNSDFNNFNFNNLNELSKEIIELFNKPEYISALTLNGKNFLNLIETTRNSVDSTFNLLKDWMNVDLNELLQNNSTNSNHLFSLAFVNVVSSKFFKIFTTILFCIITNFIFSIVLFAFSISFISKNKKLEKTQKVSSVLLGFNLFFAILNILFFAIFEIISVIFWLIIHIKLRKKHKINDSIEENQENISNNDKNKEKSKNDTIKFNTNLSF